jgi:hypothetical protein
MIKGRIRGFYFHHLPRSEKYGKKGVKRLDEEGSDQEWRIAGRNTEIRKKGLKEGCMVHVAGRKPKYEIKSISKDGFLVLVGSRVRVTPGDCALVA